VSSSDPKRSLGLNDPYSPHVSGFSQSPHYIWKDMSRPPCELHAMRHLFSRTALVSLCQFAFPSFPVTFTRVLLTPFRFSCVYKRTPPLSPPRLAKSFTSSARFFPRLIISLMPSFFDDRRFRFCYFPYYTFPAPAFSFRLLLTLEIKTAPLVGTHGSNSLPSTMPAQFARARRVSFRCSDP